MAADVSVRVVLAFTYQLPADEAERDALYGATDIAECVRIDLDNDPMAFLGDAEWEVVAVEVPV